MNQQNLVTKIQKVLRSTKDQPPKSVVVDQSVTNFVAYQSAYHEGWIEGRKKLRKAVNEILKVTQDEALWSFKPHIPAWKG